ncbi:hypothetical protein OCUAc17_22790 [Acinetobacter pittii]|nr:hypothetical protein OCUAc17_22790 [Acinetobacter pittii]
MCSSPIRIVAFIGYKKLDSVTFIDRFSEMRLISSKGKYQTFLILFRFLLGTSKGIATLPVPNPRKK